MKNKGFAPITVILLAVVGLAILGAGVYYYLKPSAPAAVTQVPAGNDGTSSSAPTSTVPIVTPSSTTSTSTVSHPSSTASNPPTGENTSSSDNFIMMPDSGPVGTSVIIYGSGFAAAGNTVTINGLVSGSLKNLTSSGGSVRFTIPSAVGPNCAPNEMCAQYLMEVTPNVYTIAVISNGITRTVGSFTVTASGTIDPMHK